MNTRWKSGIVALVVLAAIAWLGLDGDGSAQTLQTRNDSAVECNSRSHLATALPRSTSDTRSGMGSSSRLSKISCEP